MIWLWRSLVARCLRVAEVVGSNPASQTYTINVQRGVCRRLRHPASKAGIRAKARGFDTCAPRVTTFVYAPFKWQADRWARGQGLRPRDLRAFGDRCNGWRDGVHYRPEDRIVVLGSVGRRAEAMVVRMQAKTQGAPPIERVELAAGPLPA